jgi:hypothetical protein
VIKALIYLAERSLPQSLDDLISESNVIAYFTDVFGILIVKTMIVYSFWRGTKKFLIACVYVINLIVLQELCSLMVQEVL